MTNYITTLKSLKQLPAIEAADSIYIIAKSDEFLKVSDLAVLMDINKNVDGRLTLSIYSLKEELSLAVGTPIIQNPTEEFILADASFPAFQMFGDRVKKLSKKTTGKSTGKRTIKRKKSSEKIATEELQGSVLPSLSSNVPEEAVAEIKANPITATLGDTDHDSHKESSKPAKANSASKSKGSGRSKKQKQEERSKGVDNNLEEKRVLLAGELKKIVDLDPADYDFLFEKDVFYLMIAQIFERSANDDEVKRTLQTQPNGETLLSKLEPYFEEIKSFMANL